MAFLTRVKHLDLELSSHCNARCPACPRTYDYLNQLLSPTNLDLSLFEKMLASKELDAIESITACGVLGDPFAHPDLLKFAKATENIRPGITISFHTNGSLGTEQTWRSLAHVKGVRIQVTFSIDGLEDSNHFYRRGVSWEKIMRNAKLFIGEGGKAVWKAIEFGYNKNQISKMRSLAEEMGFVEFQLRQNLNKRVDPKSEAEDFSQMLEHRPIDYLNTSDQDLIDSIRLREKIDPDQSYPIECESRGRQVLFLDSHGQVWPCCHLVENTATRLRDPRNEHFFRKVIDRHGPDFNSLKVHSLSQILNHPWYQNELIEGWRSTLSNSDTTQLPICITTCGQACKSKREPIASTS